VGTGEGSLVEDCTESTDEGPHAGDDELFSVLLWVADVEDPAAIAYISIVTICKTITAEASDNGSSIDNCGVGWQVEVIGGGLHSSAEPYGHSTEHRQGTDDFRHHDEGRRKVTEKIKRYLEYAIEFNSVTLHCRF